MRQRPAHAARGRRRTAGVAAVVVLAAMVGTAAVATLRQAPSPAPSPPPARAAASATRPAATPTPSATPTPTPSTTPTPRPQGTLPAVRRLRAADHHALSAAASRSAFRGGAGASVVYLVGDRDLEVGWAAVPAAAARGGVVLLTARDRLPAETAAEITRLEPDEAVVVGDSRAVSVAVVRAVDRLVPTVTRLDEDDPRSAARSLSAAAFPTASAAWVAAAGRPSDLAQAAAAAAAHRAPLLVVDGDARRPPAADTALLERLGVQEVTLVGGPSAVSRDVEAALEAALGPAAVTRAQAADRAALAARVHRLAWHGATPGSAYLANPERPTDALTGAFLAGRARVPLLWTSLHCLPAATRTAVLSRTVGRVVVVGGEVSVRSLVDRFEPCRSLQDPSSTWVLVNKRNPVSPMGYAPSDLVVPAMEHSGGHTLRAEAAAALARMAAAVAAEGAGRVGIDTAYRSYATQRDLYADTVARRGRAWTDRWYLRPGYSEHQTGLTVDLLPIGRSNCTINDCIDETPQGRWLARNSWRFGFILRYEQGYEPTTGVAFEPWHFRYVGSSLARAYHEGGWHTLEAFLGRPAAPGY